MFSLQKLAQKKLERVAIRCIFFATGQLKFLQGVTGGRFFSKKSPPDKIYAWLHFSLIVLFLVWIAICGFAREPASLFREDFNDLKNWKPLTFPKIKKHSTYKIEKNGAESFLKTASEASASGLIYKNKFNVYEYPLVKWRWKVENVYQKGDAKTKKGDDYPLRVYIIFEYNPDSASFFDKVKYNTAKLVYGEYPPDSGLNYIWANKNHREYFITSAYTSRSKMIIRQKGVKNLGSWQNERVNIVEDYQAAFGEPPPARASIAIMNDSDNTGESSVSFIDYIEVYH